MARCRYNDLWRFVVQQLIFFAAFVVFLESQRCVTLPELETILGSMWTLCLLPVAGTAAHQS